MATSTSGPRVTIVDVAREAGVAISTVSAALNGRPGVAEETRLRVGEVASRMGWIPSMRGRSLSSKRTFSVGMVIQRNPRVIEADPFFWGFIGGVESVLDRHGYAFVLHTATTGPQTLQRIRELSLSRGIDGIFLTDVRTRDPRFALVAELGLPAVAVNAEPAHSPVPTINQDHAAALREVMQLLLDQGHTRIAHLSGAPALVHSRQREMVWRSTMESAGLATDLFFQGDFTIDCGVLAADDLLRRHEPPTAVVCANDLSAIGFLSRARQLGVRVPDELSLTGFDGIPMGQYTSTPLTTVETSPHDLGRSAAQLLIEAIEGRPRADVTIRPARLLQRGSTAGPRAGLLILAR